MQIFIRFISPPKITAKMIVKRKAPIVMKNL